MILWQSLKMTTQPRQERKDNEIEPTTAVSYTIEHVTKRPVWGKGNWYRLRLNYSPRQRNGGNVTGAVSRFNYFDTRIQVERYVARFYPQLPEAPAK